MKKLDFNERKLCQIQGEIFEKSIKRVETSSLIFIRRFMLSKLVVKFDDYSYFVTSLDINDCFEEISKEYGESMYGKIKYSKNEMFWIGYIYRALAILYKLSSKKIFSLFNSREIVKYYNIYHTFDIEDACERMMENIGYIPKDISKEAYLLFKKHILREKLRKMIGQDLKVYVDRAIGSTHPKHSDIVYSLNYGYTKKYIAADGEYQDCYIMGIDEPVKEINGKIYAIIERENDIEDKLLITVDNKEYSIEEIKEKIYFQEKYFKYKIFK